MKKALSLAIIGLLVFSMLSILASMPVLADTVDEYFIYSKFDPPGISDVVAAGGYVEYYGVPEWGDEIQHIYFLSGNIGYKVKVWVTDGDGDGKIEPRQHPNHYLSDYVGPIEPRHFQIVSSADLSGYTGGSRYHTEEFYVDSSGVYLGAYPYGIHKWDHDWNYIGKVANRPPERTESMAYNPAENVWYAGGRYRTIYQLSDTDNDGSFLDESWVAIFTYPSYGGSHHDGMEYVGGYLWISDMTSDVIGKWQYNPTTNAWDELKRFTYTEPGDVEGMGFGPNDHFWCGSGWGSGSYIYELGNEITLGYPIADAGRDVDAHPPTIPVKFDASGSHHTDPAKEIVLYEWDFESDGIWDYSFGRFVYPTGKKPTIDPPYVYGYGGGEAKTYYLFAGGHYAGWLARGDKGHYVGGKYHIGQDIEGKKGDPVYAIADGNIVYVHTGNADWGWDQRVGGKENFGYFVEHVANGETFLALYGHVKPMLPELMEAPEGKLAHPIPVYAGQSFAKLDEIWYPTEDGADRKSTQAHLHFGIRPQPYNIPPDSPWGALPITNDNWPDENKPPKTNGFVDPIEWITTRTPLKPVPLYVEHAYPAYYNPDGSIDWDKTAKDYTATLRVTDNSDPPLQDTDTRIVHITSPPWKPVADPDGPYEGYKKAPVQLDGSKSFDPESKMFPSDHPWYETIATYEWDIDHDGQFDDATGAKPTYTWDSEGLYIIGLKVTDSQPSGSGGAVGPLDVDIKYTTVVIKSPVTLIITNRQKLIEFAKFGGLTEEEANEKVDGLLNTLKRLHPEAMIVFMEKAISDASDWEKIDTHIENLWASYKFNYLVIVGNPYVIPFCVVDDPTGQEKDVTTDFFYSEINGDDYQDLPTGRIVGMTIDDMINNVKRLESQNIMTGSIVSSGDSATDDIGDTISQSLTNNGFDVTKLYLSKKTLTNENYVANLPNRGIIVHVGHGNAIEWGGAKGKKVAVLALSSENVSETGLGDSTPIVVGMSCLSADLFWNWYPPNSGEHYEISINFIHKGAAAYVGSTRYVYFKPVGKGYSEHMVEYLVDHLMKGYDLGTAFMKAKRDYRAKDGAIWWSDKDRKTLLEWVLYGDPKFDPILPKESKTGKSSLQLGSSLKLTFDIPGYNHYTVNGYDIIEIPGGHLSTHQGYPILPIFIKELKLSSGENLVNSRLLVAEKTTLDGTYTIAIDQVVAPPPIDKITTREDIEVEFQTGEIYPGFLYRITIFDEPDGSRTAILVVAPLQYIKKTGEVQLYWHIELELIAEPSALKVKPLTWEISNPLVPSESICQAFSVENLGVASISEININAEGEIAKWITFNPTKIVDLSPSEPDWFVATITIPLETPFGFYTGYIKLSSDFGGQTIPVFLLIRPSLPLTSMWITDSEFNNITSFRAVFTPYRNTANYQLTATNPGQFYYNILVNNTWIEPLNITVSYDIDANFTFKGAKPIHAYADLYHTIDITSTCTFEDNKIIAYNVPPGGIIYVTIHLDYALKKTTWTKSQVEAWYSEHTFNATAETDISSIKSSVTITDPETIMPPEPVFLVFLIVAFPSVFMFFGLLILEKYGPLTIRRRKEN